MTEFSCGDANPVTHGLYAYGTASAKGGEGGVKQTTSVDGSKRPAWEVEHGETGYASRRGVLDQGQSVDSSRVSDAP